MKFWELVSAFRDETEILNKVLQSSKWKEYKHNYDNYVCLVDQQNRQILNSDIPFDLGYDVCEKSKLKFWLYYEREPQILSFLQRNKNEECEHISALEVFIRFGGSAIEEVLERGTTKVFPPKLNGNVEIINVFNLSTLGMVAFIRAEKGLDLTGKLLSTKDGQKKWFVLKRPVMFVSPVSAYIKMENQEAQGIFQYIIRPICDKEKPNPAEILTIVT